MTKSELVEKVNYLLSKNKTKEALKLLSRAQLSEDDKSVILLMGQWSEFQRDSIINKNSSEERRRMQTSINNSILSLAENIDAEELELKKPFDTGFQHGVIKTIANKGNVLSSYRIRSSVIAISLLLLLFFIMRDRIFDSNKITQIETNQFTTVDAKLNKANVNESGASVIFSEDFSNPNSATFRKDIWKNVENNKLYRCGLNRKRGMYEFEIKNRNFTRHKYFGGLNYNLFEGEYEISTKILIDENLECLSRMNCIGRGITLRYDNKLKSCYSLTLNDSGELYFKELSNFNDPQYSRTIFIEHINVKKNTLYDLGVLIRGKFV